MPSPRPVNYPKPLQRIRMFQISGVSLITLAILNTLFRAQITFAADLALLTTGLGLLLLSVLLWRRYRIQQKLKLKVHDKRSNNSTLTATRQHRHPLSF